MPSRAGDGSAQAAAGSALTGLACHTFNMRRFTITIDNALDDAFEAHMAERGYANRSEAVRDLIRQETNREHVQLHPVDACMAVLSYLYVPQERSLALRLVELQQENSSLIDACTATQANANLRMEVQLLRGRVADLRAYAWSVISLPGVQHGEVHFRAVPGVLRDSGFVLAAEMQMGRQGPGRG